MPLHWQLLECFCWGFSCRRILGILWEHRSKLTTFRKKIRSIIILLNIITNKLFKQFFLEYWIFGKKFHWIHRPSIPRRTFAFLMGNNIFFSIRTSFYSYSLLSIPSLPSIKCLELLFLCELLCYTFSTVIDTIWWSNWVMGIY